MNFKLGNLNTLGAKLLGLLHPTRIRPARDWVLVITSALVLLLALGGWSYWLFIGFTTLSPIGATAGTMNTSASASLTAVETLFTERATTQTYYLTTAHFVDPSK